MKRVVVVLLLLGAIGGSAFAYGAGGFFSGEYLPADGYTNIGRQFETHGGFGYGAGRDGIRHGGFGLVITGDEFGDVAGAFGGLFTGAQYATGPFTLSINLWTGAGYINPEMFPIQDYVGYIAEGTLEAGFAPLPWFQMSAYVGMQALGSFDAAALFSDICYTPVVGTRLSWGSF
jgi:hypothetical protein